MNHQRLKKSFMIFLKWKKIGSMSISERTKMKEGTKYCVSLDTPAASGAESRHVVTTYQYSFKINLSPKDKEMELFLEKVMKNKVQ